MNSENEGPKDVMIEISLEQKKSKRFVIVWTCLFGILFPFVFWMSLWSIFIFDNPRTTGFTGIPIICAFLCIPLSMLVSIWKMWSHYFHKQYSDTYWFCSLPFFVLLFAIFFTSVVEKLFLRR